MADPASPAGQDLSTLLGGIVEDVETLIGQQLTLFRVEAGRELRRVAEGAGEVAAGGALLTAGGVVGGVAAVHLVHRLTRLPLWACYGAAAAGLGAAGVALVRRGRAEVTSVQLLPPPETAAAARENVAWLTDTPETR